MTPTIKAPQHDPSRTLIIMAVVVAALYFGQEIFVPIALAILLGFVLAPAVRRLHALGLGRVFPVILTTVLAFSIIFVLIGLVATQVRELASDLPRYEDTMTKKIGTLRSVASGGALQRIEDVFAKLDRAANRAQPQPNTESGDQSPAPGQPAAVASPDAKPMVVEVRQPAPTPIETISLYAGPLLHPLATAGIVVIFVVFILLQREDLRNRLIRLFGAGDLQRTTAAIDDGAKRLSRYLLTQLLLNAVAGLIIGTAARVYGVPNPVLWGILFACLRFVPYIGPIIGGILPVLLAAAVTSGWTTVIWMAATVLAVELMVGQILEPLLYGHNTGLSPVAVVLAATFWTALWGPVGLLLATPITVCLVVIGRHVDQLAFLDVLLGDQPPLTAPETFYQRMLANDPIEVAEQAVVSLRQSTLIDYYDTVVLPGLLLAQVDVLRERLGLERQKEIRDATDELIHDLEDHDDADAGKRVGWQLFSRDKAADGEKSTAVDMIQLAPAWQQDGAVLCIGGRSPLDDCGALMLAQALEKRGLGARAESFTMLGKAQIASLDVSRVRLIVLSCLDGSSNAYLRFVLRRIHRRAPRAKVLVGAWWMQTTMTAAVTEGGDDERGFSEPSVSTIVDGLRFCLAAASVLTADELASGGEDEATEPAA